MCPGTVSLEVTLRNKLCRPHYSIEMNFDLKNVLGNLQEIKIALVLDLKIWSLREPRLLVEHVSQELGSETISKQDLQQNTDSARNLLHTFQMTKIEEQNDIIRNKYLVRNPNGVNMIMA